MTTQLQSLASEVARLREKVDELAVRRVDELAVRRGGDTRDPATGQPPDRSGELRWALQQVNAANEELHEALERQAEAAEGLRQALEKAEAAAAAIRRSDRLRSEVIGVLLTPDDPQDLLR